MKVYGTDVKGCLTSTPISDAKGLINVGDANPLIVSVNSMQEWSMKGWVPSIVTAMPVDDEHMLALEMWLSKAKVPYSNLLMGVTSFTDAMRWLNCDFFVTSDPAAHHVSLAMNKKLKLYVMRNHSNKEYERYQANPVPGVEGNIKSRIHFVDSFKKITELENA